MSLVEKLTSIKTKLTSVLSDINAALVAKGATEVTSLADVPTAIESVQSGGSTGESSGVVKKVVPLAGVEDEEVELNYALWELFNIENPAMRTYAVDLFLNGTDFSTYANLLESLSYVNYEDFGLDESYGLIEVKNFNATNVTSLDGTFTESTAIVSVENINNPKNCNLTNTFAGCTNLKKVTDITFHNNCTPFDRCTNLETIVINGMYKLNGYTASVFKSCVNLKNVTVKDTITRQINFTYSPLLTQESLHHLIEMLKDYSQMSKPPYNNFTVGSENLAKIDEEHMAMLNAKNWNYS